MGTIDFRSTTEAFTPARLPVTVSGASAGDSVSIFGTIHSTNGFLQLTQVAATSFPMFVVPQGQLATSDLHEFHAIASSTTGTVRNERLVGASRRDFGAGLQLTLSSLLASAALATVSTSPFTRVRVQAARQAEYSQLWMTLLTQPSASVALLIGGGYLGSATTVDFTLPDFSTVVGWQNVWTLQPGLETEWHHIACGWAIGDGGRVEGQVERWAARSGKFVP
ncbi:MAG: hypothetical protein IPK85_00565 [Gemmatimonadetes bacterium]|nr:hypothetical protein [Gemmatimonadota bacterium]